MANDDNHDSDKSNHDHIVWRTTLHDNNCHDTNKTDNDNNSDDNAYNDDNNNNDNNNNDNNQKHIGFHKSQNKQ